MVLETMTPKSNQNPELLEYKEISLRNNPFINRFWGRQKPDRYRRGRFCVWQGL